jgi:hypothetical protein
MDHRFNVKNFTGLGWPRPATTSPIVVRRKFRDASSSCTDWPLKA